MHAGGEDDGSATELIARAEAAIAELRRDYPNWALNDVVAARAALDEAVADPALRGPRLQRVYELAHDIKGQGGSFGYDLATRIGQSLCRLLRTTDRSTVDLALARQHLDALNLIFLKKIDGDGGTMGDRIAQRLETLVGSGPVTGATSTRR
jgi:hypothetical protein